VARSIKDSCRDAEVNVTGTLRMLEAGRKVRSEAFVFLSSAAVYGEAQELPVTENHPARPPSPYGLSKLAAMRYVEYYRASAFMPTATLIPANVYGPGQLAADDGDVVAAFARAAVRGEPIQIAGDGSQTRDLIYVGDLVDAIWTAWAWLRAEATGTAEVAATREEGIDSQHSTRLPGSDATFNASTGTETSIGELPDVIEKAAGCRSARLRLPSRTGDIARSRLSPERARAVLGWSPRVSLSEGLSRTLAWWHAVDNAGSSPKSLRRPLPARAKGSNPRSRGGGS
jgi:UDP-glucose 4-epimerase